MIAQLQYTEYQTHFDYGAGVEAYEFKRKLERVHVAWAIHPNSIIDLQVPDNDFIAAYDREGALLDPPLIGNNRQISLGFSPIFIIRYP